MLRQKWRRLNVNNEHWMCCIVGEEGSGKSYTAVKIGELVDPNFGAENIYFHPANALEDLREENFEKGDVWVLDESGVGLGNRTWHDSGQKKLNQALQLIRSHNIGLIFTLPALSGLDTQTKRRLQNALELTTKEDGEYVRGRWWRSNVDRMGFSSRSRDVWWEREHVNGAELQTVAFTPPSSDVVSAYEERKAEFQQDFYDETIAELRGEEQEDDQAKDMEELAEEATEEEIAECLSWHGGHNKPYLSPDKVRARWDLSRHEGKVLKQLLADRPDVNAEEIWEAHK
jgi:ABC-type dipeptide/oligopeptide/nickel transport system ATPase component